MSNPLTERGWVEFTDGRRLYASRDPWCLCSEGKKCAHHGAQERAMKTEHNTVNLAKLALLRKLWRSTKYCSCGDNEKCSECPPRQERRCTAGTSR